MRKIDFAQVIPIFPAFIFKKKLYPLLFHRYWFPRLEPTNRLVFYCGMKFLHVYSVSVFSKN